MPTDAAMVSTPPEEHEGYLGGRCPPEESRIRTSHTPTMEHHITDVNHDESALDLPTQLPTPPPTERESPQRALSPPEAHTKPVEMPIEGRGRLKPAPVNATDDSAREQRDTQASPPSTTASTLISWSEHNYLTSPRPTHRVCNTYVASTKPVRVLSVVFLTCYSFCQILPLRSFAPAAGSRATRPPIASSTKSK
jgi:hypothetical protein